MDPTKETQAEFEARYNRDSNRGRDLFDSAMVSLPCTCEDGGGPTHWTAIANNEMSLELHESNEKLHEEGYR